MVKVLRFARKFMNAEEQRCFDTQTAKSTHTFAGIIDLAHIDAKKDRELWFGRSGANHNIRLLRRNWLDFRGPDFVLVSVEQII